MARGGHVEGCGHHANITRTRRERPTPGTRFADRARVDPRAACARAPPVRAVEERHDRMPMNRHPAQSLHRPEPPPPGITPEPEPPEPDIVPPGTPEPFHDPEGDPPVHPPPEREPPTREPPVHAPPTGVPPAAFTPSMEGPR